MTEPRLLTEGADSPNTRLSERLAAMRRGRRGIPAERWLLITGGALLPFGLFVIVLGWVGASHTVFLFQQVPYVVSGGLLGLALVIAGGFIYFAYWQTMVVRELQTSRDAVVDELRKMREDMSRVTEAVTAAPGKRSTKSA